MAKKINEVFYELMPLILVIITIGLLGSLTHIYQTEISNGDPIKITYSKPIGGEDRAYETVELYCFTGYSKGVTGGSLWCQEQVIETTKD